MLGCLLGGLCALPGASAQSLESALAPGKLIQGHAKWEDDCKSCHVRFDRAAQDGLCMDCHKDVARDLRARAGYHGRIPAQACRSCHTDHKGRDARTAQFDTRQFDHRLTDYTLQGRHEQLACASCHLPGRRFRDAPGACQACHAKNDVHKGRLGTACADCHTEARWTETRFDHTKTKFALTGRHATAACADCHRNRADFQDTPKTCIGCHRKQDDGARGHQGRFGERCDSCHGTKAWKPATFNHDTDTRYALRGKHRGAACGDCHTGPLQKQKLASDCIGCHRQDDKHRGTLGTQCESCHSERDWKERGRFDHGKTAFALLGKHVQVRCDACHRSLQFNEAPKACVGCHRSDDKHQGTLGDRCESCHQERDWKGTAGRFDHAQTKFPLRNAHAAPKLECQACHRDLRSLRATATACVACHGKDDRHQGQLGRECGQCHDDKSWRVAAFDHARTRFVLAGRHAAAACKDCHKTARYREAPRECVGCHRKDDRHQGVFGEACASCHNARNWVLWDFDHERRSAYRLDGAHRQVACEACHTQPAPAAKAVAPLAASCIGCHRRDDRHDGGFGNVCESCHITADWKRVSNRLQRTSPPGARP